MKHLNNFIKESIFDIDDESIINKRGDELVTFKNEETEKEFNHVNPMSIKELNNILMIISKNVDKFNEYKYVVKEVFFTSISKELIVFAYDYDLKQDIAYIQYTELLGGESNKKFSYFSYALTKKQQSQLEKILHKIKI